MSFSKQKSHITRTKILSPTDTESIETLLDSIESRLNDDIFKDVMNILHIDPSHIHSYSQINYNKIKPNTSGNNTNTIFRQNKSNRNNVDIDKLNVDIDSEAELGPTLATLTMLQTFYNSA
jgi:hypothetical protein